MSAAAARFGRQYAEDRRAQAHGTAEIWAGLAVCLPGWLCPGRSDVLARRSGPTRPRPPPCPSAAGTRSDARNRVEIGPTGYQTRSPGASRPPYRSRCSRSAKRENLSIGGQEDPWSPLDRNDHIQGNGWRAAFRRVKPRPRHDSVQIFQGYRSSNRSRDPRFRHPRPCRQTHAGRREKLPRPSSDRPFSAVI